ARRDQNINHEDSKKTKDTNKTERAGRTPDRCVLGGLRGQTFLFRVLLVFRDLRGKALLLYCVTVRDADGFDRDPPEVFVRCVLADTMNGMLAIRYETPQSVAEAVRLMAADPGAHVLAGGTD